MERGVNMAKRLNFGIVGGGMIGLSHLKSIKLNGQNVTWLADVDATLAAKVGREHDVPNVTTDYRTMLEDRKLDAVVVATPPFLHSAIGIDALRAGKHLLMEKPLAHTVRAARALSTEAQKHPRLVASGCSSRYSTRNPKWLAIKRLIDSGKLGHVYHVNQVSVGRQSRPGIEYNPGARWFLDKTKAGGGPLYDWGVYDLMTVLALLREPVFQSAKAVCMNGLDRHFPKGAGFVEEHGAAFLTFKNGLTYYWERAFNAHGEAGDQVRIYGTKGGLMFAYPGWQSPDIRFFYVNSKGTAVERTITVPNAKDWNSEPSLMRAFIDAVLRKGPVPTALEYELNNLKTLQAVYKAAGWHKN
jgi:predicted dehydrogenase